MAQQGFRERPVLNLIKNACACMDECKQIGGKCGGEHFLCAKAEVINRMRDGKKNNACHNGTEAAE